MSREREGQGLLVCVGVLVVALLVVVTMVRSTPLPNSKAPPVYHRWRFVLT